MAVSGDSSDRESRGLLPAGLRSDTGGATLGVGRAGFPVCVGGIPGVGKTSLLRELVGFPGCKDRSLTGSSVLREVIAPSTLEDFEGWHPERKAAARESAVRRLVERSSSCEGFLLVDGHFTLREGAMSALERVFTLADEQFYRALVLVEAGAPEVLSWRARDRRPRHLESLEEVCEHLEAERAEALRLARRMRVPLTLVSATDLGQGARMLRGFLEQGVSRGREA